jgi:hypothetical protein
MAWDFGTRLIQACGLFRSVFGLLALILLYRANNAISSRLEAKAAMALTFAERR